MIRRFRDFTRRLARDETGTPAVEFALTLPALAMLVFGVIQIGMAFTAYAGVRNAVEVGARFATVFPYPADAAIRTKVTNNTFGVDRSKLGTPTIARGTANGSNYVEVSLTYPVSISLGLANLPTYTMSYSRRAYQQ